MVVLRVETGIFQVLLLSAHRVDVEQDIERIDVVNCVKVKLFLNYDIVEDRKVHVVLLFWDYCPNFETEPGLVPLGVVG